MAPQLVSTVRGVFDFLDLSAQWQLCGQTIRGINGSRGRKWKIKPPPLLSPPLPLPSLFPSLFPSLPPSPSLPFLLSLPPSSFPFPSLPFLQLPSLPFLLPPSPSPFPFPSLPFPSLPPSPFLFFCQRNEACTRQEEMSSETQRTCSPDLEQVRQIRRWSICALQINRRRNQRVGENSVRICATIVVHAKKAERLRTRGASRAPSCCQHFHHSKRLCAPSTARLHPNHNQAIVYLSPGTTSRTCVLCLVGRDATMLFTL